MCNRKWVKKEKLGRGVSGVVYRACCAESCSFVMKQVKKSHFNKTRFRNEIQIQSLLGEKGLAPRVHYASDSGRFVIMDALTQNYWDFMKQLMNGPSSAAAKRKVTLELTSEILSLIRSIHALNITHGDVHGGNIMRNSRGRWYLIDFGLAEKTKNRSDKRKDLQELWNTVYGQTKDYDRALFLPSLRLIAKALGQKNVSRFVKEQTYFE